MAYGIGQTEANLLLTARFNAAALATVTTYYLELYTATPSDTGGGTETVYTNYVRVAITNNATNYATVSAGAVNVATATTFATCGATGATLTQAGLNTASSAGTLAYWGDLTASQVIANGNTPSFAANSITVQMV
jgi:hypothetical protein